MLKNDLQLKSATPLLPHSYSFAHFTKITQQSKIRKLVTQCKIECGRSFEKRKNCIYRSTLFKRELKQSAQLSNEVVWTLKLYIYELVKL
jgi:hypothetical protein